MALDSENTLVEFDLRTGMLVKKQKLGPRPAAASVVIAGHRLALSPDAATAYALIPVADHSSAVVALARHTLALRWTASLPAAAGHPGALVVGPRTGSIFAITSNDIGAGIQGFGPRAEVIATQLDPVHGSLGESTVVRRPDLASRAPEDWFVLQGLIDPRETSLYVSFHNQGLFEYDLSRPGFAPRCTESTCLSLHGDAAFWQGAILTATGSRKVELVSTAGVPQRIFDTQLDRNHLMTFAIDSARNLLYAVGSCKYVPGLTVVNLESGASHVAASESNNSLPCGDRIVLAGGRLILSPGVQVLTRRQVPSWPTPDSLRSTSSANREASEGEDMKTRPTRKPFSDPFEHLIEFRRRVAGSEI